MRLIQLIFGLSAIAISVCSIAGAALSREAGPRWFMGIIALVFGWTGLKWLRGSKSDTWRTDAATAKQKSFANELGIKYPTNISKGDLSDLISQKTGR
jgi:hypothetical protein